MKKILSSWYWIDKLNKHKFTSNIYVFLKKHIKKGDFKIEQLCELEFLKSELEEVRVTIVLPSLRKSKVFGGVSTALKFFDGIISNGGFSGRIIVIGQEKFDPELTIDIEDNVLSQKVEIQFIEDSKQVNVGRNDYFIYTTWKSAFIFEKLVEWQRETFDLDDRKAIYLIQDYEPGFVPWSSEFALADSTYRTNSNKKIAVFNSKELFDYFNFNKYSFSHELYFKPTLNDQLRKELLDGSINFKREKRIIVYGRPHEPRNAYEILISSLELFSKKYPKAREWTIVSLGAPNRDVKLKNNTIICKGKLTLPEYANTMFTSYAGISLMISPHPSYPPLEMSTFGVKTITNQFINKNLEDFNSNLYSVKSCTPEVICDKLIDICEKYDPNTLPDINEEYLYGEDFEKCVVKITNYVKNSSYNMRIDYDF